MNLSEECSRALEMRNFELERAAAYGRQTPETPAPPVVWNSNEQTVARPLELHDSIRDRVMIKADGITFEGTCARWVTGSLICLGLGLFIFKPTAFSGQAIRSLINSDTVPKRED